MASKSTKKSIAAAPVIRAKTSPNAFIATGHNHDDRYVRYDDPQAGLDNNEINQLLSNMQCGTSATSKTVRADAPQELPSERKAQARANIGIIDDIQSSDGSGDIRTSSFGNRVGSISPVNNDLLQHFVRFDTNQTITVPQQTQIASNINVLSLNSGLSEQEINSSIRFNGSSFILNGGQAQLNKGTTIKGTPLNDTLSTVKIGAPSGSETAIIHIAAGTTASTTVAMSCSNKRIVSAQDPINNQDVSTKKYVDDQITALDFSGSYLSLNGENSMGADLDAGGHNIENMAAPTQNNHSATKQYVDDAGQILTGVDNNTSGGFTPASSPISPVRTGLHLAILSGKVTSGSVGVLTVTLQQNGSTLATKYINTDGAGQWNLTIPVSLASISNVTVTGSAGIAFNQFDLVQFGH